jgi:hypothetical protein
LTFDPSLDRFPIWSSDGSRIVFDSTRKGPRDLYQKPSNGTGNEEVLVESLLDKVAGDSGGGTNIDLGRQYDVARATAVFGSMLLRTRRLDRRSPSSSIGRRRPSNEPCGLGILSRKRRGWTTEA